MDEKTMNEAEVTSSSSTCSLDDTQREKPIIERKREWLHPQEGTCPRKSEPIYTAPDTLPRPCGSGVWRGGCGGEEWQSGGIVLRDKASKNIVRREGTGRRVIYNGK